VRLDKFQKEFEQIHNRKIRYTKDIAPISQDFKKYKDLKSDIQRLENMIASMSKGNGIRG
jgi:hypothetical protein